VSTASRSDAAQLERLLEAGRALVAELDLEVVLERLLETARELTGARYAAIGVLDAAGPERLGDSQRPVREVAAGRQQLDGDPVARQRLEREHALDPGHAAAGDEHAQRRRRGHAANLGARTGGRIRSGAHPAAGFPQRRVQVSG
jgi:GAF domain-containing protein